MPAERIQPDRQRRGAWLFVVASAMVACLLGISIGALGPVLPVLHAQLHVPLDQLGLLLGVDFAGSLAATLVVGPLLDRRPGRPLMVAGGVLVLAGLGLLPLAPDLVVALVAMSLTGLGVGTYSIGSTVLAGRLFGGHGGRVLSVFNMLFGLGAFVGPLVAAALLNAVHDYRPLFLGIAAAQIVPMVLYTLAPVPGPPGQQVSARVHLPRTVRPAVVLLAALIFLYLGTEIGFGSWIFILLRQTTNTSVTGASWVTSSFWLALGAGSLATALRPRRVQAEWLVFWCALGATVAAVAMVCTAGNLGVAFVAVATLGLCLGPIYPLSTAAPAELAPAAAGRITALVIASSQMGGMVLPWVQGLLLAQGAVWSMAMTALVCVAMAVLQLAYLRVRRGARWPDTRPLSLAVQVGETAPTTLGDEEEVLPAHTQDQRRASSPKSTGHEGEVLPAQAPGTSSRVRT